MCATIQLNSVLLYGFQVILETIRLDTADGSCPFLYHVPEHLEYLSQIEKHQKSNKKRDAPNASRVL